MTVIYYVRDESSVLIVRSFPGPHLWFDRLIGTSETRCMDASDSAVKEYIEGWSSTGDVTASMTATLADAGFCATMCAAGSGAGA